MTIRAINENVDINIDYFPDGTPLIRVNSGAHSFENVTLEWRYTGAKELSNLSYITRYLQDHGAKHIDLLMPYIPNARFDRVNNDDEVFTLKYFAEIINNLHFDNVLVLDAHSNVSLALINKVKQINVAHFIQKAIDDFKPDALFMPDEGAHKRYSSMFDLPSTFGIKTRDWRTGEIEDYFLADPESIRDKRVLIIDDISSRGGTFYYAAQLLHKHNAKNIGLYITHCEKTISKGDVLDESISHIEKVYTADPLWEDDEKDLKLKTIKVID